MSRRGGKKRLSRKDKKKLFEAANKIFADVDLLNVQLAKVGLSLVDSLEKGVELLSTLFINIMDFVDGKLDIFPTYWALRSYSLSSHRIFPLKEAKSMGLRSLLVKFF